MNRLRNLVLASALAVAASSCGGDSSTGPQYPLAGSYVATEFKATPPLQGELDVLARGGSLTLTVNADNTTSGTMVIPASITGTGSTSTTSLAGTANRIDRGTVVFTWPADIFLKGLTWGIYEKVLFVGDQVTGGARVTVVLTRQ